jgi:hypothetical protein
VLVMCWWCVGGVLRGVLRGLRVRLLYAIN